MQTTVINCDRLFWSEKNKQGQSNIKCSEKVHKVSRRQVSRCPTRSRQEIFPSSNFCEAQRTQ